MRYKKIILYSENIIFMKSSGKKNKFSNFQKKLIKFLEIKYKIIFLWSENNIFVESLEKVSMMVQYFDTSGIWMPGKVQKWSIVAVFWGFGRI